MNNNDIVIRLRYALNLTSADLHHIFSLGGLEISGATLDKVMTKQDAETPFDQHLSTHDLEAFLNGLVVYKRGVKKDAQGQEVKLSFDITEPAMINNVAIKKIKIALHYTSEDLQELMALAGDQISKGELSAVLRRPDHRNYRPAGDRYLRKILKGMALKYRSN